MKKNLLLVVLICTFGMNLDAQIVFSHANTANSPLWLDKFPVSGYKYVQPDIAAKKIFIYNLNNTLFKTITIPATTYSLQQVAYVSENLFDLDNQMEYAVQTQTMVSSSGYMYAVSVFDETGPLLFNRDSAIFTSYNQNNIFHNTEMIYFDGSNTKMKLNIYNTSKKEFYTLPGNVPCSDCISGIVTPIISNGGNTGTENDARFFPNPATDQLKLKYTLPPDYKEAFIKIHDVSGRLLEELQITAAFDFIYLPTHYNNGLYLYSLIVDGKTIKTEKIILNK